MTWLRAAAILVWLHAAGFGLPVIPVARSLALNRELPVVPVFGFRAYGGGWFERFEIATFVWLLMAFLLVCLLEALSGWLLWGARPSGAILALALLPVEAVFWVGFALPIPPVLALARTVLVVLGWGALRG